MQTAFKEWAIVVDALGRGDQILILRKGGIAEGRQGFQVQADNFFLFPTRFHQQRDNVLPAAQQRFDSLRLAELPENQVVIEYWAHVEESIHVDQIETLGKWVGQHIWCDSVLHDRFAWGKETGLYALAVRVFRLPAPKPFSMLPQYGGCRSWTELESDLSTEGSTAVLSEPEFQTKLHNFRLALRS